MSAKHTQIHSIIVLFVVVTQLSSCASLTESQLRMVTNLTVASDSVAVAPAVIFEELAAVRTERGLFYAASLTSAEARGKEINALAKASYDDEQLAGRANVYVNVLNSYLRALRSLSADARWKGYGTEWRGIGRNIDSLILRFNQADLLETDLPAGWSKLSGQYIGYMSERYMRGRQAKMVRAFVNEGDTLVSSCVDGLIELLKKGEVNELIENEAEGLKNHYDSYLHRLESAGAIADMSADRRYIELVKQMEAVKKTRNRCVTALQSLKRAHNKLVKELEKKQKIDYYYEELLELNTLSLQLQKMIE